MPHTDMSSLGAGRGGHRGVGEVVTVAFETSDETFDMVET